MADVNDLKATLEGVKASLHAEFTGPGATDRLNQFDAHLATVEMVIDCLFDEAERMEGYR